MKNHYNSIILSAHPVWCGKMASGEKDLEVRKRLPNLKPPFKVYLYCTRLSELQYWKSASGAYVSEKARSVRDFCGAGRVIGEFTCSRIYRYSTREEISDDISTDELIRRSCLTGRELYEYECSVGYRFSPDERMGLKAMEITDLVLYDRPKLLQDFGVAKPPQSWFYVKKVPA